MSNDLFDLTGKNAVVTGAAMGLGRVFCEAMAEHGANVVASDIDEQGLAETKRIVEALGVECHTVRCDVSKEKDVANMVAEGRKAFGSIDILFNNAGIADAEPAPVHAYKTENWFQVINIDLHGVFFCARECLKVMVEQGAGKVINISSMWGLSGASSVFPIPAYNAAKGAVSNLTREMGLEYAPMGINVNAICPGFFTTRLAGGAYDNPDFVKAITEFTPANRVADADELKGAAIFLASKASNYIFGHNLIIDGGCSAK